jgi:hypothetical protein
MYEQLPQYSLLVLGSTSRLQCKDWYRSVGSGLTLCVNVGESS